MASLENRTMGLKSASITERINEGVTTFSMEYLTPLKPTALKTGQYVKFELYDATQPGETAVIGGRLQRVRRNTKDNNKIYAISGRNEGYFLVRNGFAVDSSLTSLNTFYPYDILLTILENTNIEIGGGTPAFDNTITFHTNGNLSGGYSGIWKSKKAAIDELFKMYAQAKGCNKIRWYIDGENKLRWFEINKPRGNIINFETQRDIIANFDVDENAENIVNELTGYACDDKISTTQRIQASVDRFGLQVGDPLTDSSIKTQSELNAKVEEELNQKAWEIYTAKLVVKKFYNIEMGQQVYFVDDPAYGNVLFTCVQKVIDLKAGDITTTLDFTTDESAIAPTTTADVTQAIVNNAIQDSKSKLGTIVDVADNDCTQLLVRPYGTNNLVNVKSHNSCTNYNVGGLSSGG